MEKVNSTNSHLNIDAKVQYIFAKAFGLSLNDVKIIDLTDNRFSCYKENFFRNLSAIDSFFKELADLGFNSIILYNHIGYASGFSFHNGEFCQFWTNHYGEEESSLVTEAIINKQTQKHKNKQASILFCQENNIPLKYLAHVNFLMHHDKSPKAKERLYKFVHQFKR